VAQVAGSRQTLLVALKTLKTGELSRWEG